MLRHGVSQRLNLKCRASMAAPVQGRGASNRHLLL